MTAHVPSVTDVTAILDEIQRSRNEVATASPERSATAVTMNLVVFIDDPDYRDWVLERAVRVVEKYPSRLVVLDRTRADGAADILTAESGAPCGERVDLAIAGLEAPVVRALVHDLTVPDIPTVFWWSASRVLANPNLTALSEYATTVIVDSSGSVASEQTIKELATFLAADTRLVVHDLAFLRLAPWRDMIAQFFDEPALFDDLFSLRSLEIDAGSEAESLYLAGWLGSRLSWAAVDRDTFRGRDGNEIAFTRHHKGGRRRVLRVALASSDSTYSAELTDDETVVRLTVAGARAKPSWCVPLQSIDNASLIEQCVMSFGHNQVFETSLQTVGELLR